MKAVLYRFQSPPARLGEAPEPRTGSAGDLVEEQISDDAEPVQLPPAA